MNPIDIQLVRRLHHTVGKTPRSKMVWIQAGDVGQLLNIIRDEERRADVAEFKLRSLLTRAAEENLETLLRPEG